MENRKLTILAAKEEEAFKKRRLVLTFVETEKMLSLNKTQSDAISAAYTKDYTTWRNKVVMLSLGKAEFPANSGKFVPSVVVTPVPAV